MSQPRYFLKEAYVILFSREPENLEQWQMAKKFVDGFDGRLFVDDPRKENTACAALAFIIKYVIFPVGVGHENIIQKAIGLLIELDSRIGEDFSAGLAGHLLRQYEERLTVA